MTSFAAMTEAEQTAHIKDLERGGFDRAAWACRHFLRLGKWPSVSLGSRK